MAFINATMVLHLGIPVDDLERSLDFYTNVLGLKLSSELSKSGRLARLHCGDDPVPGQQVVLFKRPKPLQRDAYTEDGITHQSFVVSSADYDTACEKFREMGLFRAEQMYGTPPHRTLEFVDPDGNHLQLSDRAED